MNPKLKSLIEFIESHDCARWIDIVDDNGPKIIVESLCYGKEQGHFWSRETIDATFSAVRDWLGY